MVTNYSIKFDFNSLRFDFDWVIIFMNYRLRVGYIK